jgi:HD superfamily phosphohydrolase
MERLYRDPVHNIITLDPAKPDDALLITLIDTPEFQRLRSIKQLGLALYTYQGAEHSRFTHSLGVMHLMTRVLDQLAKRVPIAIGDRVVGRVAALLHDLGHGPFSHVIEQVLHENHERWTVRILADPTTSVHRQLAAFDAALPEKVIATIEHRSQPSFIGQLVSSQLDVDRFDYLLRDTLMTGVKYGQYDLEWILHALGIDASTGQLYVEASASYAVEEYLQARYYMFRQVYFHRTLRAAEAVLMSIFRRAVELAREGQLGFVLRGSVMEAVLSGRRLTTAEYLRFDDHDMMFHIKEWAREADPVLQDLATRFVSRKLFKAIDLPSDESARGRSVARFRARVEALGYDPAYYLIEDLAADTPYYSYYRPEGKGRLYLRVGREGEGSTLVDIADFSPVVRGMVGYEVHRLCLPEEALAEEALAPQGPISLGRREADDSTE